MIVIHFTQSAAHPLKASTPPARLSSPSPTDKATRISALHKLWPVAHDVLRLRLPKPIPPDRQPPIKEVHWLIVIGIVASQFINMTKDTLKPRIGATLVMESAVITSKVDPETIDPGKWRISTGEAEDPITRLHKQNSKDRKTSNEYSERLDS